MDINFKNLNDLAHKILHEDLCTSYDIVHEHMDMLKDIDCHGQTFLEAVFCKAIDKADIVFFQHNLLHLSCAHYKQRIGVAAHAVNGKMPLEHIQILLDYDFRSTGDDPPEKPIDCLEVLMAVGCLCAAQERWDVFNWIASCLEDAVEKEVLYLSCHYSNPETFRHSQTLLDPITMVYTALDPLTLVDYQWTRDTCNTLLAYGLETLDHALQTSALTCDLLILYKLCAYIYHRNTKHILSYIQQPEVVKAIQNSDNLHNVYNLIHLSFFRNTPHVVQLLLDMVLEKQIKTRFLPQTIVHNMVWYNFPHWISSKHVRKLDATECLPFAVVYNHKEMGMLLLDVGVDLSHSIDWKEIEPWAKQFYGGEIGGEFKSVMWQQRLDSWVREYEKSVLEIELQSITAPDSHRKM